MGVHVKQAMWFKVEIMTAIGNHMVFVLVRFKRDTIHCLLEQIDGRRGIHREHVSSHRRRETGIDLIKGEDDVDCLSLQLGKHLAKICEIESEELAREHKELAQEIEALEHA